MKIKALALTAALLGSTSVYAQSFDPIFTIEGKKYHVSVLNGTYLDLIEQLETASWWGNAEPWSGYFLHELHQRDPDYKPNTVFGDNTSPLILNNISSGDDETFLEISYGYLLGDEFAVGGTNFRLSEDGDTNYYWLYAYLMGLSASDTLNSFRPNAFALRNVYNQQSALIAQGLSYDCTTYDAKGVCVSFAGSRSDTKGQFDASMSNTLIAAYKPNSHVRFGGYLEQSFGTSTSGGLTINKGNPSFGFFGAWTQNADGSGVQVRAAANMGTVDIETQRQAVGSAEAGYGESEVKSSGFLLEASQTSN